VRILPVTLGLVGEPETARLAETELVEALEPFVVVAHVVSARLRGHRGHGRLNGYGRYRQHYHG
jgi:hypothetical protein